MTDRELLELAALAAGMDFSDWDWSIYSGYSRGKYDDFQHWNPLTDDGDALRLAVKLGIRITPYPLYSEEKHSVITSRRFCAPPQDDDNTYVGPEILEYYGGTDKTAATRRAIVRAAAEIGKSMAR